VTAITTIDGVLDELETVRRRLADADDPRVHFVATYRRTTEAVAAALAQGTFVDAAWAETWDVAFANLYLDALRRWDAGGEVPGPWGVAFAAAEGPALPPLQHVLLGMNAHINYDLPQALLTVVGEEDFQDPDVLAMRRRDHENIDRILAGRVRDEDHELRRVERPGDRTWTDRALTPWNRWGTRRFLAEARGKVWRNAELMDRARRDGTLEQRRAELEALARQRVSDLQAPGRVLLRLARLGFGIELPDGAGGVRRSPAPSDRAGW
jgi:hypothetical protein